MICITVTPTSRTLAKVDLLNAARHGDVIELCVDHLLKEPDFPDLLKTVDKPIIVSCRRPQDGGQWKGTEDERLMLLRQAIAAGPEYVELDLDIASKIPPFGAVQRIISFTRMDRPEQDIDSVFDEAVQNRADVVKFTWPTPTIDDAWPLLVAVSQKRRLPIVGMGLGQAELTFSLLGRKFGSPWIYAALEPGMEAHPGQATVFDLDEIYDFRAINRQTGFVAIAGFGPAQQRATQVLNRAFAELGMNVRCLPFQPGDIRVLKKMLESLKVKALLVKGGLGRDIVPLADSLGEHDQPSRYADLLLRRDEGWRGYNTLWRAGLRVLEDLCRQEGEGGERPLERLNVLVLGNGGIAQSLVHAVKQRKGMVSICGPDVEDAQTIAAQNQCRMVPYHNLYDTLADVIIIADGRLQAGQRQGQVNPSLCRPGQIVMDVCDPPLESTLFAEARERQCRLVDPEAVFAAQIQAQFKALTGKDLPVAALDAGR